MDRTIEEINDVLSLAKLNVNDLLPTSQSIYFIDDSSISENYKFLQLNPHLTAQLKESKRLYINGSAEDNSVICSDTNSFEILNTETSNSLLLVKNLKFHEELNTKTGTNETQNVTKVSVQKIFYEYLEVIQLKPKLNKLNFLLQKAGYKGPEQESQIKDEDLFTFEELWRKISASKNELRCALNSIQAVVINDKIRILDFEYHFRVLSYMLKLIDENSWRLNEIDYDETINALNDLVPIEILNNLFELYTEESKIVDGLQLYKYKEDEVCKFFAKVLLHSAGKFNLREFLQAWQESVPEGMQTNKDMLNGVAIIDYKSMPSVIWAFPENKLPENINERFKALFEAKEKWTVPEISPYIKRLTTDKLDVNALLAKYARTSKVDGVKVYSSKHGK